MLEQPELPPEPATVRCAIYTRKSRKDGLDRVFNSLQAQRLACEEYIEGQRKQGWELIPDKYEDFDYSGDDPKRPALNQLFEDIGKGLINCVVLYRLDRLARSVELLSQMRKFFKEHNVTFFSITEHFDTTTAVGRLAFGMSATVAEYEKDICAERVRHKIAASKKLGMWMGGSIPLGYDVEHRKLIINEAEADTVRFIYQRFLEIESITTILNELNDKGLTTKCWISAKTGKRHGGWVFRKNTIRGILTNRIYNGKITHKGEVFEGQHEAIIDDETFNRVKHIFEQKKQPRASTNRMTSTPFLKGLLSCGECGAAMTPVFANKNQKTKKYRYYQCEHQINGKNRLCPIGRISSGEIESAVIKQILRLLRNPEVITKTITAAHHNTALSEFEVIEALKSVGQVWESLFPIEQAHVVIELIESVVIKNAGITLTIYKEALYKLAYEVQNDEQKEREKIVDTGEPTITLFIPVTFKKRQGKTLIITPPNVEDEDDRHDRFYDEKLITTFAKAYQWRKWLETGRYKHLSDISRKEKMTLEHVNRVYRLNRIAPAIVEAIVEGKQPRDLTIYRFLRASIPLLWCEQLELFGFTEKTPSNNDAANQRYQNESHSTQLQEVTSC